METSMSDLRAALAHAGALEDQVRALREAVVALTGALAEQGNIGKAEMRAIIAAARVGRAERVETEDDETAPPSDAEREATFGAPRGGSPYRDAPPVQMTASVYCGRCGKGLAEDDPTMNLASRGRVCMTCYARGE